jgi:tripartite-type tricarboxylate transporter receptor subunit TctC
MRSLFTRRGRAALVAAAAVLGLAACSNPQGVGGGGGGDTGANAELPSRIEMLIPYSEGGGTDTWARFLAPYLEKHVEGNPSFSPRNVPGGESITGSNEFVQTGGTDGETVLVTSGTTYFQALLGRPEVKFDFAKMRPLMLNGTGGVIYASAESGLKTAEDLANPPKPLTYGGISATGLDLSLLQAFDVLGVDIDATFGFEGRGPARLALERGEVNIDYQTTSAYLTQVQPLVDEGKAVPLMSFGVIKDGEIVRDPNLPDLPTVEEVYKKLNGEEPSGTAYEAYRAFLVPGFVYQKGLWANEGTPDSIVQAFWDAVEPISNDEDFKASSEEVLGGYPLYSGEQAKDDLLEAFQIKPEVRQYTLDMLKTKYDTTVDGS